LVLEDDMADTADGAGKTEHESARRLARMIGHDVEHADISAWKRLAFEFRKAQIMRLQETLGYLQINQDVPLVGAGVGRFLVRALADQMNKPYLDVETLINTSNEAAHWASVCLPAVAVARLSKGNIS
jgi:uncharacterized hydantoinase/oxoprolinase family protein